MTIASLLILCTGLLAMSAAFGVAWWLWTYDPAWPWTTQVQQSSPTGSHAALPPRARADANHIVAPVPIPVPANGESELAATMFFVKGKSPEKTEILTDRPELLAFRRDEDAPVAYEDQLRTRPNRRAGPHS
jgi:hypothetical protein